MAIFHRFYHPSLLSSLISSLLPLFGICGRSGLMIKLVLKLPLCLLINDDYFDKSGFGVNFAY